MSVVHVVDWDNTGMERTQAMQQGRMLTFCGLRVRDERKNWTHPELAVGGLQRGCVIWFLPATCQPCLAGLTVRALQDCSIS